MKTATADVVAQTVTEGAKLADIDVQRSVLFCLFGASYLGAYQYMYQVNVLKKIFDVDKFATQSGSDKLKDYPGLLALAAQTVWIWLFLH